MQPSKLVWFQCRNSQKRALQGSANFVFGTLAGEAIDDTAGKVNEP